ncbi:MAG TPA: VTT domain-containing protein [Acidimicrobiales bacterium]|jgi:membrane-associated protein|nr:VTT domain-containing protein [Acidimicrobiales bacterium]
MRSLLAAGGFLDPEELLRKGGLALLGLIVFAESGLLVGFFLPGDSLLFIAGFLASDAGGNVLPPLPLVLLVAFVTAVVGDQVGYIFGKKVGPALFDKPDSRIFKQKYVEKAHGFFERHGAKTIVLARFVPIVRTFAPIVAGVGEMRYRTFVTFNVVGGFLWAVGITTLGYFLGEIDFIKQNIEVAIVVIVALSVLPMAIEFFRHWRAAKRHADVVDSVDLPPVPADVPATD